MLTSTKRFSIAMAVAAASVATVVSLPSAGNAATPAPAASKAATVVGHKMTLTSEVTKLQKGTGAAAEQKALASYWSASRMKAATDASQIPSFKAAVAKARMTPQSAASAAAAAKPQGPAGLLGPAKKASAPATVSKAPNMQAQYSYAGLPYYAPAARTNGKVFFTQGGLNYVCSAAIVNSEGKSLLWTAGHCLVDNKVWDSNFVFVPSYSNGWAPYGYWYSRYIYSTSGWYNNGDFSQDEGAVIVNRNFGYRIADYLGGQGIAWNYSANYYNCAFGYPQAYPFTGAYLYEACGNTFYNYSYTNTIGMLSGLTGGSSGGPWLRWFDGNWGWVNGHNDFIYTNNPAYMYSPYSGNTVANLFNYVRYISA
jgi:hypothetical protein